MRKCIILMLALACAGITRADEPRGSVNMKGVSVTQVLEVYAHLVGKELVIESGVTNQFKSIHLQIQSATKSELTKSIEQALRTQANVVITPLDAKRAAVKLVKSAPTS